MKKRLKRMKTDKQAEDLLEQDLSEFLDSDNFSSVTFEFEPKDVSVTLRMSDNLLHAIKQKAKRRGVSYQKLMREILEKYLNKKTS